jgi:hypothetical protein
MKRCVITLRNVVNVGPKTVPENIIKRDNFIRIIKRFYSIAPSISNKLLFCIYMKNSIQYNYYSPAESYFGLLIHPLKLFCVVSDEVGWPHGLKIKTLIKSFLEKIF